MRKIEKIKSKKKEELTVLFSGYPLKMTCQKSVSSRGAHCEEY